MPIFEYRCRDCGRSFETIVNSSSPRTVCKSCGSKKVEQLLSVFAVAGGTSTSAAAVSEPGPCACGAPRRGMCGG
ncbi:MAG: zinc ribbon domain-containing protein [Acidobacteria bacterium]|nr:zinc ribbon domain-containing protein [Acidobacteriota bacterium]